MVRIIGTPFKSRNTIAGIRTNKLIRERIKISGLNKRDIELRNIKDKISAKNLPSPHSPGAKE